MVRLVFIQSAILSLIALAVNRLRGAPLLPLAWGPETLRACVAAVGLGGATVAASALLSARVGWAQRLEAHIRATLGPLGRGEIAALATAGPIGEELFFRAMLQPALAGGLRSPLAALVVATGLFAIMHLVLDRDGRPLWAWAAFAFVLGLLLGGLLMWSGNILPPVLLHIAVNAGNLTRLAAPRARRARRSAQPGDLARALKDNHG